MLANKYRQENHVRPWDKRALIDIKIENKIKAKKNTSFPEKEENELENTSICSKPLLITKKKHFQVCSCVTIPLTQRGAIFFKIITL